MKVRSVVKVGDAVIRFFELLSSDVGAMEQIRQQKHEVIVSTNGLRK